MKRLNITKEQFEKSRYFKNKYGKLEYISESGDVYKTDKGKVLMFKDSNTSQWIEVDITWGSENDSLPDTVFVKTTLGKMPSRIELECELEETYGDQILHVDTYPVSEIDSLCDCFKCIGDKLKPFDPSRITKKELSTNWESTKKSGRKFNESDAVQDAYDKYSACSTEPKICHAIKINDDGTEEKTSIWMGRGNSIGGIVKAIKDGRLRKVLKFSESRKPKFVKESTGDNVEVCAVVKGIGRTIEEAIDNFDSELTSLGSDRWGDWTDNYDPETDEYKDRDYWTAEYNKWQEENEGDVDITVVDDRGNAQGFYGHVTISNTDEY